MIKEVEGKKNYWTKTVVVPKLIEGLVMKPCHENNGATIDVGRAATVHNPLF